jgi:hypothetical protein
MVAMNCFGLSSRFRQYGFRFVSLRCRAEPRSKAGPIEGSVLIPSPSQGVISLSWLPF